MACLLAVIWPQTVFGSNPALDKLDEVAVIQGPFSASSDSALVEFIGLIIGIGLSLIGVIFLILMIFAGYNWMTAQGEEEKVNKAKSIIIQCIIGIIIVVGAYASWKFLFSRLF